MDNKYTIPLIKDTFFNENETKRELANFILSSHQLSMGEICAEFENDFANYQGRNNAILFNSGSSANLALLQALKNLGLFMEGDKIGFSALTWSTNVMPIIQLGFIPIAIDCDVRTLNVMSYTLEERLKENEIKALFITNVLGFAGDLEVIKKICDEKNIILLEDNCESLGTILTSGRTGNFGFASTFSFYVAHHISTIEGGMVCTDDENLADMLRIVRAHGWDRNLKEAKQTELRKKYKIENDFFSKYSFYDLGYNLRPTEITGFIGNYQLKFLEYIIKQRAKNFEILKQVVANNDDLLSVNTSHIQTISNFAFPVICKSILKREKYIQRFNKAGVEVRPIIAGNVLRQPFFNKYCKTKFNLSNSNHIHECGFYFGNYPELTENDLSVLKDCLRK